MLNSDGQGHGRRRGRAGQQDADAKPLSNSHAEIEDRQPGHPDTDLKPLYKYEGQRSGRQPGHTDADHKTLSNSPSENLNIAECD